MTGGALRGRPLVDAICVALAARNRRMRARQRERGLVVIKCGWSPGRRRVTTGTLRRETRGRMLGARHPVRIRLMA